jgi:hypothetical protein
MRIGETTVTESDGGEDVARWKKGGNNAWELCSFCDELGFNRNLMFDTLGLLSVCISLSSRMNAWIGWFI